MDPTVVIDWLAGLFVEPSEPMTWQVFADRPGVDVRPYWTHAPFADVADRLERDNERGAGVFAMINAGDGRGRNNACVRRVRAVFVDCDSGDLPASMHAPPSMVVQSANGQHAYWASADTPVAAFAETQSRLARRYGTDRSIKDPARVMRVAGFHHHKRDPYPVTLARLSSWGMYRHDDIVAGLPYLPRAPRPLPPPPPPPGGYPARADFATLDAVALFADRGWYGRQLADGRHAVACPWIDGHTRATPASASDTVLFDAAAGKWPQFFCSHDACDGRRIVDVLRLVGFDAAGAYCTTTTTSAPPPRRLTWDW